MLLKLLKWIYKLGYDKGYEDAENDIRSANAQSKAEAEFIEKIQADIELEK